MKRKAYIAFLSITALFLLSGLLLIRLGMGQTVSHYEQRTLSALPEPTAESVMDGAYFSALEVFIADHIKGRDQLLRLHTALDLALGRPVVNDLLVDSDVLLDFHGYSRWNLDYVAEEAGKRGEAYGQLRSRVEMRGGYFCYLGLPLQTTYFSSAYPAYTDDRQWQMSTIRQSFSRAMEEEDIPFLDMYAVYEAQGFPREYYYATDHHFSLQGAYAAYEVLMRHLQTQGLVTSYLGKEDFLWETLPNPFLGSANRKLYGLWESADTIEIAQPKESIPFTRTDGGAEVNTIFSLPGTPQYTATYSIYMGGDKAETVIQTHRPELPNILIYGDSFSNALETLLWTNFNETRSLDFRYYSEKTLLEYVEEYRPDIVICIRDEISYLSETGNGITK